MTLDLMTGDPQLPGIYRYSGSQSNLGLLRSATRQGFFGGIIDGQAVADKATFLHAAARALRFPAYFGHNWDAFEECVTDMAWARGAEGYLLLYDNPRPFATAAPLEWQKALGILAEAVAYWREKDRAFYVLLRHTRGAAPEFPLLRGLGLGWRNRWA